MLIMRMWSDPSARASQLKVLVQDSEAVLGVALEHTEDPEGCTLGWVMANILGDDFERDEQGHFQVGEGTAPEQIISLNDIQMRHGRKSAARRFDGQSSFELTLRLRHKWNQIVYTSLVAAALVGVSITW
jgi:hypothetical protein